MGFGQIEAMQGSGVTLAFERQDGAAPTFVWLGGFKSDMSGTKAQALAHWARERGQGFLRFDYSGHGQSGGSFEDGSISRWLDDTLTVIGAQTSGDLVLVGSSMGGWLALLTARRTARVKGLLLIAPAADFTERLMWPSFSPEQQAEIMSEGRLALPSAYSAEPTIITRAMIEDGKTHSLMHAPYPFAGPVRILQGGDDPDVPTAHVQALTAILQSEDVRLDIIAAGDHRLSRPQDIARLVATADDLADQLAH
ncbi:MAG: alpha/beta hydrolase [Hyphomonadaceae bacterium]